MTEPEPDIPPPSLSSAQANMLILIGAVTLGSILYRIVVHARMEQTSLLFIGIPAILAAFLALAPPAKSVIGGIVKGITFMLLLSGPLLGEGFICIVMASPIFLLVGVLVGAVIEWSKRREHRRRLQCCVFLVLVPVCLEGTSPKLSFARAEQVEASAIVSGTPPEVRERLSRSPQLDRQLPAFLRAGFPRPEWAVGDR